MIPFSHVRNYALYLLAVERGLRVASTLDRRLKVSSSRRPWLPLEDWYDVFVTDGFYSCACQEPYPKPKACSHGSLASVAVFPSLLSGWLLADCQRIREERHAEETKGWREEKKARVKEGERETARLIQFNADIHKLRLEESQGRQEALTMLRRIGRERKRAA